MQQYEQCISDCDKLILIVSTLNKTDSLWLVMRHLDLVKKNADIVRITRHVPKISRLALMLHLIDRCRNDSTQIWDKENATLSTNLNLLSNIEEKQILIREYLKYSVHNNEDLRTVLTFLPHE